MIQRALVATLVLTLACTTSGSKTGVGQGGSGGSAGGGAGAAGAGGAAGGAGGSAGTSAGNSVLERNNHPSRDGAFVQPALTQAAAATMALDTGFAATFTGNMWASPLFFENGPAGKGIFIAVTTNNDVIALDETTGAVVWTKNIGAPAAITGAGCGSINPIGIISTPVIDPQTRTLYVAGAIGNASGITSHVAVALSLDDGSIKTGWPIDVSTKLAWGNATNAHNQRSALSLVNGILYVAYGGHVGDCGGYRGRVVAINTANPSAVANWATGGQGEAIWAAGGMASDGTSVFAITGNHTPRNSDASRVDSEEVVRVSGMAVLDKSSPKNFFFPTRWSMMDATDADFGSNSPVFLPVAGATPSSFIAAITKDGHFFLLDAANLGGANGSTPLADVMVSNGAMTIHTTPAAYRTAQGVHVTLSTDGGAQCPGGGGGEVVMSVLVPPGAPPVPRALWCATITGGPASPIATTTDGTSNPIVWIMSGTRLMGFDGDTGSVVFNGGNGTCAAVRKWTSPIAVKGRIVVGGDGHLCSWSPR